MKAKRKIRGTARRNAGLMDTLTDARARSLALKFAEYADDFTKLMVGFFTDTRLVFPYAMSISVLDDGSIVTALSNHTDLQIGTFDSMVNWINWIANSSGMNDKDRRDWAAIVDSRVYFSPEFAKRRAHALPPPKTTAEGIPFNRQYPGETVQSLDELLGECTIEDIIDNEGEAGLLWALIDIANQYPINWTFDDSLYQPDQFEIHGFRDYRGDRRLDLLQIMKTGPTRPGDPEPDAVLTSGSPGDKYETEVVHVVGAFKDERGNNYVWYYKVFSAPFWAEDFQSETFDEDYLSELRRMIDPKMHSKIIMEYDIACSDPGSYQQDEIGLLGITLVAMMLDGTVLTLRPEPKIVYEDPKNLTPKEILASVERFNGLSSDDELTQFSRGLVWGGRSRFRNDPPDR